MVGFGKKLQKARVPTWEVLLRELELTFHPKITKGLLRI
uniref:Uncharacterized protein n=1 Tax=Physcomitrium patens TaxID=3218 RepID=A0A7I4EBM3_PHYPA